MPSFPVSATCLLGQTIDNGALRIEAVLGAGSFGVVYRAVDTQSGAHYAVKRVERDNEDYHQTRETQLHARVSSHPHVLTFHREIDAGYFAFFVYDLCAGDFHSVIRKLTFFREDELVKRVFVQIIDAVEYCHSRGVYHRDLKPENILVSSKTGEFDVFVADFGLSTTSKMTASSCGTPCFMSPESLVPHHTPYSTVEGDVWALGCILAEMIANVRPWRFASPEDRDYSDYLGDCTMLYEMLPISDAAYTLLAKIFSTQSSQRPSLAAMREEVLAVDTFFVSDGEAARWGWKERVEKKLLRKMGKVGTSSWSSRCSEETSSGSFYSGTASSSASLYSCGSSSSAFESSSSRPSPLPITPPAKAVDVFRTIEKAPSRLELGLRIAVAQSI